MTDRVKQMMRNSTSRLHISKPSVTHIGATPYRFRLDVFVSYADNVKNISHACVTLERRANVEATPVVQVAQNKAVFRHTLSMELTLFRRAASSSAAASDKDTLKFDEKKAKFALRKAAVDGKAVGKLTLDIAEYVRGTNSTVFADIKLSNGTTLVTKIEATMLHIGKKKKGGGSRAGSEACSEMTDVNSVDNDSLFGDDDQDLGDLEIETTSPPPDFEPKHPVTCSPVSSNATSSLSSFQSNIESREKEASKVGSGSKDEGKKKGKDHISSLNLSGSKRTKHKSAKHALKESEDMKNSPSLKDKIKGKMKGKKDKEKDRAMDKRARKEEGEDRKTNLTSKSESQSDHVAAQTASELAKLKAKVQVLEKENTKLKASKQAAMDEVEALRADLEACEAALEETKNQQSAGGQKATGVPHLDMSRTLREKEKKIAELEAQNESLLEELEELHEGAVDSAMGVAQGEMKGLQKKIAELETENEGLLEEIEEMQKKGDNNRGASTGVVTALKKKIEELEVALKREPQYMDVVNELKVTKVSLALANMEKEQALFALQSHSAAFSTQS
eukprot:GFKZ01003007.1.p2 GENE.GFKZ01003007.1~~GFKZ01003007.1.p2  ORF type:complete len:563 (+),score=152.99 GFKZ01003007.1:552-2240(+)